MQSLIDELRGDQGRPTQCLVCAWLDGRPAAEQKEWDAALADRAAFTHSSIHRALSRRDVKISRGSVENHRTNGHRRP